MQDKTFSLNRIEFSAFVFRIIPHNHRRIGVTVLRLEVF
jgi:hypothetical protein